VPPSPTTPKLVEQVYHATAAEVRATGVPWDFAPCVCVSRDERWGRSYEAFGEDPALDWQGRSGDTIPGTTILEGIRQAAPHARVTYSADASAPIGKNDIGVVVVGETPYAEGFGDVGGPAWPWGTDAQKETKSLTLQPSDKAAIDKVCDAVTKCVVLVVSGRPQIITDQLGKIDALVASWLPGSEGAGVADVLFGKRAFTGRLPVTWPADTGQIPINIGDRIYRPLYPYGWGLRTSITPERRVVPAAGHPADPAGSQVADRRGSVAKFTSSTSQIDREALPAAN
jgi:hypothetical protein